MESLVGLAILVLDIIAIVSVVRSGLSTGKKILWIALILLLPVIGMLLYLMISTHPGIDVQPAQPLCGPSRSRIQNRTIGVCFCTEDSIA